MIFLCKIFIVSDYPSTLQFHLAKNLFVRTNSISSDLKKLFGSTLHSW